MSSLLVIHQVRHALMGWNRDIDRFIEQIDGGPYGFPIEGALEQAPGIVNRDLGVVAIHEFRMLKTDFRQTGGSDPSVHSIEEL